MALETKLGPVQASFAVDTGASVNVLSERAYRALKRVSRGGRYRLMPNDLNLRGVTSDPLDILGIVRLPVNLGKGTSTMRLDFYVASNFGLPSDGLLGLTSMRSNRMVIIPDSNVIKYQGKSFQAMETPSSLASLSRYEKKVQKAPDGEFVSAQSVSVVREVPTEQGEGTLTDSGAKPRVKAASGKTINPGNWTVVQATVIGSHNIPDRTAMHIPVSVPNARVGCDICIEGPSKVKRLAVEPTLCTVRDGHQTSALVVNNTGGPIKLRQGVFLSEALAYDGRVAPEPVDLAESSVAPVCASVSTDLMTQTQELENLVTVADYPELRNSLIQLLKRYRDVFALPGEPLGATDRAEHHIKLKPGTNPIYIPAYRLPHSQRQVVEEQIKEMLEQGVIENSRSPWNSPLFLVPKKNGQFRPVIDFRQVNEVTEDERFPLPVLKDLLMSLGQGNKFFSSLDLVSGYWQVPMAPESRAVTAFSTPQGHFQWKRMPFGLKSAPITFQRMMNTIFAEEIGKDVYVYLDDVIICGKDLRSHLGSLESVLLKLRDSGLKAKLTKCEFLKSRIKFLGHVVDGDGIHTVEDKILAVKNFPQPKNAENVRSFLGLCGYYRSFVKGFSKIASPLNTLLRKDIPFHWNAAQNKSFEDLKFALTHAPVLAFPDYEAPFILFTDASALGLGSVLMQTDASGKNRVIAYASRTLKPAESNYSVTHQETLAIIWALKHFKDIILGYPITVYTDHVAVTELFKGRNLSGRLARWYLTIREFNPTFKYLPGRANVVADALSRNVHVGGVVEQTPTIQNFSLHELANAQRQHDVWSKVIYALESGDETTLPKTHVPFSQFSLTKEKVLCRCWTSGKRDPVTQLVIPESHVPVVLSLLHDTAIAGHKGKDRTLSAARMNYYWPTMRVDIDEYINKCVQCAQHKGSVPKPAPILEYPPPERPWDVVAIDVLQLSVRSRQGSKYVLVMVDHFSRYVVLAPLYDKSAKAVAHALVTNLFCPYSAPRVLLSDNGTEFRNNVLEEICKQFGIKQTFTVAYHPASNGLVERANRKILDVLRPVVNGFMENWEDWLPHVAASINSSVCESTGRTPYFIIYGVEKKLPYDLLSSPQNPVNNVDDYAKCQLKVFSDTYKGVTNRLKASKTVMSSQQHRRSSPVRIKIGDSVMVKVPERNAKLAPKFVGPRLVVNKLHGHKFEILDPLLNTLEVVHCDRLKRTDVKANLDLVETAYVDKTTRLGGAQNVATHDYNLRSRN